MQGHEPLRVYSSNATIQRRYSCSDMSAAQTSVLDSHEGSEQEQSSRHRVPRRATDGATPAGGPFTTPSKPQGQSAGRGEGSSRQPLFTPSPSSPRRHSFSVDSKGTPATPSPPPGHSPPVSLFLYRRTTGDLAASGQRGEELDAAAPLPQRRDGVWPRRLKSFFLGEAASEMDDPLTPGKSGAGAGAGDAVRVPIESKLSISTGDELETDDMSSKRRPRTVDTHEGGPKSHLSQHRRSQSMSSLAGATIGSETSSYRQRRQMERMKSRSQTGDYNSDGSSAYSSPAMSPVASGAKRAADRRRVRSISDSGPTMASGASASPSRDRAAVSPPRAPRDCQPTEELGASTEDFTAETSRLSPCVEDEPPAPSSTCTGDPESVSAETSVDMSTPLQGEKKPRPVYSRQSTASSDGGDNCTPLTNRVPFFFGSTPDSSTIARLSLPLSFSPAATSSPERQQIHHQPAGTFSTPQSAARGPSSTAATVLFLASNASAGVLASPAVDRSEFPPLTATPVREMMGSVASLQVAHALQTSKLTMTADEATDLLKYALVNYCDVDSSCSGGEDSGLSDSQRIQQEEAGIIETINMLVERGNADVNAVDRDGNSLLTFVMVYSQSEEENGAVRDGIRKLVRCLVFHGINIFVSLEHMDCLHAALLLLEKDDLEWLTEMFRVRCSITSNGTIDQKKPDLTDAQYWNFFAVLVLTGHAEAATFLLEVQKVFLSAAQASALMKGCRFESMESPIDTYELLEHHGGQV
jgi:hypothetical protein